MRVSRDLYWETVRKASRGVRGASLDQYDVLDVLKWTDGIAAVGAIGPFSFDDWLHTLGFLATGASDSDIDDYRRIGHIPSGAPPDTYTLTEEQYWDGVRDVVSHAYKAAEKDLDLWPHPPTRQEELDVVRDHLWALTDGTGAGHRNGHPFTLWPRALDVLRYTQNLESFLEGSNPDEERKTRQGRDASDERWVLDQDWRKLSTAHREAAIVRLAVNALYMDAARMATATGTYVPNIRPDAYWDEIRKLERSLPYPIDFTRDVGQVRFITDYRDALDVLRLAHEPEAVGHLWLDQMVVGKVGFVPWESAPFNPIRVEDVLQAAARAAALSDADYLGFNRHPFASAAPPRITLDQYRAYVVAGARFLAAHPDQASFESFFDAEISGAHGRGGHPLLTWSHAISPFPYRALDVLYHTDRLEAVFDDKARREAYVARIPYAKGGRYGVRREYDQFDMYEGAVASDHAEGALLWIASAAFCADVLDELGGLSLSAGFTPNIRPDVYWDNIRQLSVRVHYPVDYENDQRLVTFVNDYRDALDAIRISSEPGMLGPFLSVTRVGTDPVDGTIVASLFGEPSREYTVEELILAAARMDAVTDADYWGTHRAAYPTKAPPLMSLDEYLDYVHTAAVAIARDARPGPAFEKMLNVDLYSTPTTRGVQGHPLIAIPRRAAFPFRTLDVLRHTEHPEAIWEDAFRRLEFQSGVPPDASSIDPWKTGFNKACYYAHTEDVFAWLASAAFGADILDELSVMGLSKYAPNEVG